MPLKPETTQGKSFFARTLYSLFLTAVLEGTRRYFATLPLYYSRRDIGTTIFLPLIKTQNLVKYQNLCIKESINLPNMVPVIVYWHLKWYLI